MIFSGLIKSHLFPDLSRNKPIRKLTGVEIVTDCTFTTFTGRRLTKYWLVLHSIVKMENCT